MGLLLGWVSDGYFHISNSFAIPVKGMETSVNAIEESNEYIVQYTSLYCASQVGEFEKTIVNDNTNDDDGSGNREKIENQLKKDKDDQDKKEHGEKQKRY